jgi:hypothetical protein
VVALTGVRLDRSRYGLGNRITRPGWVLAFGLLGVRECWPFSSPWQSCVLCFGFMRDAEDVGGDRPGGC